MKISIVIPTFNEEDYILETLLTIKENAVDPVEILIVDAGSEDTTLPQLIEIANERFHVDQELRGKKFESLNTGAHLTSGDVILFLDADTLLPAGFDTMIKHAIVQGAVGGAFALRFDQAPFPLNIIRFFNQARYIFSKKYFGDQAVFCTREAFNRVGGYPDLTVMESAHFCGALKQVGKLKLIKEPVITSSRRFIQGGILKVFWNDLKIYLRDLAGLSNERAGQEYWEARASPSPVDKS